MSELGAERIIVELNEASGWKPDDLPFDIRDRRAMTYNLPGMADSKTKQSASKARDLANAQRRGCAVCDGLTNGNLSRRPRAKTGACSSSKNATGSKRPAWAF